MHSGRNRTIAIVILLAANGVRPRSGEFELSELELLAERRGWRVGVDTLPLTHKVNRFRAVVWGLDPSGRRHRSVHGRGGTQGAALAMALALALATWRD